MYLLARNEEINAWLEEHPAVLGGMFIVLGFVLLTFGLIALRTGRARGKWGNEMEGPTAYLHGGVLTIAGAGSLGFALFKLWNAFF